MRYRKDITESGQEIPIIDMPGFHLQIDIDDDPVVDQVSMDKLTIAELEDMSKSLRDDTISTSMTETPDSTGKVG